MRATIILFLLGGLASWSGCASYPRGAAVDESETMRGTVPSHPWPAASPTFRPGMNPYDPRDPHFSTRPLPGGASPSNPP
jgi:hypothetical protein